ncbi:Uu.00g047640.m01.CDS01 [Anthostomella pinea]|uniref:Uu.00g047640.m01.CDS01 n=1 Tax=Anthostomella pinea TaxID=933095 RepID=A0AAI8VCK2_9PEZI|nr:Uu.00g047640.m01.CDS01 [Anthostomella pinea]
MAFFNADWQPSTAWLLASASALLILAYLISTVRSWHRLRQIPGPFLASISYLWLARVARSGRQFWTYRAMAERYGPRHLIRVGPNELSTSDPDVIRHMSGARSAYARDPWYLAARFDPYHDNVFTLLEAAPHDRFKARIAGAYGGRETPVLETGIDDQIRALVNLLARKYAGDVGPGKQRLVEFAELASYFSMDVITRSAFGEEFGYLKTDSDIYGFLAGVRETWPGLAVALDLPWMRKVLFSKTYLRYLGPKTTDTGGLGKLMGVAEEVVTKRFATDAEKQQDMLGSFISHGLSRQECATEALFMIIAGFENTSTVIRTTMLYLMGSPGVYQRFKEVVRETVRSGNASSPITYEEAKKIPYLQALIFEGLRMRPPAPGLYPKSVPPEGDMIHGKFIPGGTAIGMNTAALVRSTELFGEDADLFRPERFLEADEATRAEMERNVELVFGYGRWMCAGKPVAFMELNKVFFELMRAFDFQLADPMKPWDCRSFSQFIDENMWVRVAKSYMA